MEHQSEAAVHRRGLSSSIRTNVPIADPNNPGFFFPSGSHKIRGFETALTGYAAPDWQTSFGYAYTDARITSNDLG